MYRTREGSVVLRAMYLYAERKSSFECTVCRLAISRSTRALGLMLMLGNDDYDGEKAAASVAMFVAGNTNLSQHGWNRVYPIRSL